MSLSLVYLRQEPLEKECILTLSQQDVVAGLERVLRKKALEVKVPGFRPGNVPLSMVFSQHKESSVDTFVRQFISAHIKDIAGEEKLAQPLSYSVETPVESWTWGQLQELKVKITCVFSAPLKEIPWHGISVNNYTLEPGEKEVSALVAKDAANTLTSAPLEAPRPAAMGDFLIYTMEYQHKDEKKEVQGRFRLGDGKNLGLPREFEDKLLGVEPGFSFSETMKVPKDFPEKSLAGQKVSFNITFTDIQQAVPFTPCEEFAKSKGFDSLEALREGAKTYLKDNIETVSAIIAREELRSALGAMDLVEIAPSALEKLFKDLKRQERFFSVANEEEREKLCQEKFGRSVAEYEAFLREKARAIAQVQRVVQDTVDTENLEASEEEIAFFIQSMAREHGYTEDDMLSALKKDPSSLEVIMGNILELKAFEIMLARCTKKDVPVESLRHMRLKALGNELMADGYSSQRVQEIVKKQSQDDEAQEKEEVAALDAPTSQEAPMDTDGSTPS